MMKGVNVTYKVDNLCYEESQVFSMFRGILSSMLPRKIVSRSNFDHGMHI